MDYKKTGNNYSDLLENMLKSASKQENRAPEFANSVLEALKTQKSRSLQEVLASVVSKPNFRSRIVANGNRRYAQFEDPALTEPALPPGGSEGFDSGLSEELGDEGMPAPEGGADDDLKGKIRDAFIAACGGIEEAKACLEEVAAGDLGAGPDELSSPEAGDPLDGLASEIDEPEMPSPMPMPGDQTQPFPR